MPVKTKDAVMMELAWIGEYLPADHAALFMPGGQVDGLMWPYRLQMGGRYQLIEGTIKPDLSLNTAPEIRRYFLDRYDQIVSILEEAGVSFLKLPELTLAAKAYRPPAGGMRFTDWEARVRIELFP